MIHGLKVTIMGGELIGLCARRVAALTAKADGYADTLSKVDKLGDDLARHSGDPRERMKEREQEHRQEAAELAFIGTHLVASETYELDRQDLQRLGIVSKGY